MTLKINLLDQIEDPYFRDFCNRKFADNSSNLSVEKAREVTRLILHLEPSVENIDILSFFPNLQQLVCQLTGIKHIDLRENVNLEKIILANSPIAQLDLSPCTKLKVAELSGLLCNQFDLSHTPQLEELYINHSKLEQLDISQNRALKVLQCENSPHLSTIFVWQGFHPNSLKMKCDENIKLEELE